MFAIRIPHFVKSNEFIKNGFNHFKILMSPTPMIKVNVLIKKVKFEEPILKQ